VIDRPIIILSSPRAGSTLLFETLSQHPELWSIGGESHALIEHIPELSTVARGCVSNRLTASDATPNIVNTLRSRFLASAVSTKGQRHSSGAIRLLEKTPKNALRVSFFNKVFPDAIFIHLIRDPRENISSIIEAWRSGRFITYPNLPGWNGHWSLLLPDNWQVMRLKPVQYTAAYQWQQANQAILQGLENVPQERQLTLTYDEIKNNLASMLQQICDVAGIEKQGFDKVLQNPLPLSKYTLTSPSPNKWRNNATLLEEVTPMVEPVLELLNKKLLLAGKGTLGFDCAASSEHLMPEAISNVSRNAPCPCGSGQKFKNCHGKLA